MNNYFTTQKGFCHVLEDRLVFNKSSDPKELFDIDTAHSVISPIWTAVAVGGLVVYYILLQFASLEESELIHIGFVVAFVLYIIAWVYAHFDIVHQQLIPRNSVLKIKVRPAIMQKAYKHLVVYYRNKKGRVRRHYIILRPEDQGGIEDLEFARAIFLEANISIS